MRFAWKALLLAPLAVPLIASAGFAAGQPDDRPFALFLFLFVLSSGVSFGTTVFLFIPCLYVLSKLTVLRFYKVVILGALVGTSLLFPLSCVAYLASGPNSGPPDENYFAFLAHWCESILLIFPMGGLIIAAAYWALARRSSSRNDRPSSAIATSPRAI